MFDYTQADEYVVSSAAKALRQTLITGAINHGHEQTIQEAAEELEALTERSKEKFHHGRKMVYLFKEPDAEAVRTAARVLNNKKTVDFMKDQHKKHAKALVCGLNDLTSRFEEANS